MEAITFYPITITASQHALIRANSPSIVIINAVTAFQDRAMSHQTLYGPHNPHPLSKMRSELVCQRLDTTPEQLADFCEKWNIEGLTLFGSVLRDDFQAGGYDPSDLDFLYLFDRDARHSLFDVMHLREELEGLLHRKVDFVSKTAIQNSRNWLRFQEILGSGMIIYAKRSAVVA